MLGMQIAEVFPPGDTLCEKLEELGMPVKEFALRCGKPEPTVHDVLRGRSSVTPEMAILFESVLRIPAHVWLNLQSMYDEYDARRRQANALAEDDGWSDHFPFAEMVDKGFIRPSRELSALDKTACLLDYFGFAKTSVWKRIYQDKALPAEFHVSLSGIPEPFALSAWIRHGERAAMDRGELPAFSIGKLKERIPRMRELAQSGERNCIGELTGLCEESGIFLVCTPSLKTVEAKCVTRWWRNRPLIQISEKCSRYDIFWHSFFHGLGHIVLHGKRRMFLEGIEYEQMKAESEKEANEFASRMLFPRAASRRLSKLCVTEKTLDAFCNREHLHWIFVIGSMKKEHREEAFAKGRSIPEIELTHSAG